MINIIYGECYMRRQGLSLPPFTYTCVYLIAGAVRDFPLQPNQRIKSNFLKIILYTIDIFLILVYAVLSWVIFTLSRDYFCGFCINPRGLEVRLFLVDRCLQNTNLSYLIKNAFSSLFAVVT